MHTSYTVDQRPRSIFGLQNVFLLQNANFISQSIIGTNTLFVLSVFYKFLFILILRRWVNNYPHYRHKLYFNKNRKLITTLFFNIVPLLFSALLPSVHKLLYALKKKNRFWLSSEPRMHRFLQFFVHKMNMVLNSSMPPLFAVFTYADANKLESIQRNFKSFSSYPLWLYSWARVYWITDFMRFKATSWCPFAAMSSWDQENLALSAWH